MNRQGGDGAAGSWGITGAGVLCGIHGTTIRQGAQCYADGMMQRRGGQSSGECRIGRKDRAGSAEQAGKDQHFFHGASP